MAEQKTMTQALALYDPAKFNLVLPVTQMDHAPHGMMVSVRTVQIDARQGSDDVYPTDKGKLALTKNALQKVAVAAGISWHSVDRVDDRKHPYYWEFVAKAEVMDFDGTRRYGIGNKTVDLRDDDGNGNPGKDLSGILAAAKNAKDGPRDPKKQIDKAREFGAEMCASKAMNRAIAATLAIKRSYTKDELARPFAIPKLVPDTQDPQMRNLVAANMFGAAGQALYGQPVGDVVDGGALETREAPPDDDEEGMNPETGEFPPADEPPPAEVVLSVEQGIARVTALWNSAKAKGIDAATWQSMAAKFGVQKYRDQALAEAKLAGFEAAVNGWVKA